MIARRPTRFIGHGLLLLNCRRPAARPPQRASILCRALPRSRDISSRPPADGAIAARPATTAAWPCRSIPAVRVQSVRPRRLGGIAEHLAPDLPNAPSGAGISRCPSRQRSSHSRWRRGTARRGCCVRGGLPPGGDAAAEKLPARDPRPVVQWRPRTAGSGRALRRAPQNVAPEIHWRSWAWWHRSPNREWRRAVRRFCVRKTSCQRQRSSITTVENAGFGRQGLFLLVKCRGRVQRPALSQAFSRLTDHKRRWSVLLFAVQHLHLALIVTGSRNRRCG